MREWERERGGGCRGHHLPAYCSSWAVVASHSVHGVAGWQRACVQT